MADPKPVTVSEMLALRTASDAWDAKLKEAGKEVERSQKRFAQYTAQAAAARAAAGAAQAEVEKQLKR